MPAPNKRQVAEVAPQEPSAELCSDSPLYGETLDICVRIALFVGLPRSVGECYGLLFLERPLNMDDLMMRLSLSKGATSQGLKQLRSFGAIRLQYVPGERRDHYVAETDFSILVRGFLRDRVSPGLQDLGLRLGELERLSTGPEIPSTIRLRERIERLREWQVRAARFIPSISNALPG